MGKSATKAKNKYNAANYERINLVVQKGCKAVIQDAAAQAGQSVNAFINAAIAEKIEKEQKK
ncbi:MAG: hypothetical protein KH231_06055 [Dialister sp.]|uniref:hypothetical protein n=1 Tax=Dialister sp. TaxID=1955814 RepID=UPI001DCBEE24|nr:hypothetical protein [Dialister sp.]MBS6715020.1 hypothetical protein [Dialister sp.]